MIAPGLGGNLDDLGPRSARAHRSSGGRATGLASLATSRAGRIGVEAQRPEQLLEKLIKIGIARLRVLLLLYWFT